MKRTLINITKILLFLAGFMYAIYLFIPWQEAGKFGMSIAHSQLERRGMRLNWSDVSGEEDGFTVHNLTFSGMANISFSSITIRPRFVASVLSLSGVCDITFRGMGVRLGQTMNFGDGGFLLTAGREDILLENLRTNGEFSLNGYITFNPATMKIGRADARLEVPENFRQNMDMLKNFLPLSQEGDRWYLRRR